LHDHFHQRQHKGLFAPLVALEDVCREAAIPRLRHQQRDRPHPRVKRARSMPIAIAQSVVAALVSLRAQRFRDLRLQDLVQYGLHQFRQSVLAAQQTGQQLLACANIDCSHRFSFFG